MTEEMKSFIGMLAKDEGLQKKLQACKSPEEAFEVAKSAVSRLNYEDFTATMKKVNEAVANTKSGELSDDDLEKVAGGWSDGDTATVVSATITATGPAAASAI